ncbi:hypothetical protein FH968_19950 [Buttiauxella sp. B2]|uniref:hypothetical protein n=1 Tax=Buttiauxella sp. B2 TaxID=2587812 RepID=UPI0011217F82|nr:hypothetical protein [Buttiauxella sp. B2]TNV16115.1 hypothetical protein FH968_19950 [Buttiauxella sp. B2]
MQNTKTFKDRYAPLFIKVCNFLGGGWRVDMLEMNNEHQIKLTAPNLRRYAISARQEKGRIVLSGHLEYRYYPYGEAAQCTVSLDRSPAAIANDIRRKILPGSAEQIAAASDYHQEQQAKKQHTMILKNMMAQQVTLTNHHNALTGFYNGRGIRGAVTEIGGGYGLMFDGLDTDQLIKIVGFISTL